MQTRVQNENQIAHAYEGYYSQSQDYSVCEKVPFGDSSNFKTPEPKKYMS